MDWMNPLFIIPITTAPIFIIAGLIGQKFPPKKINGLYGYRTSNSMKSQERWDFAQRYSAREMIKWGLLMALIGFIGLIIELKAGIEVAIGLGIVILFVIILIIRTEKELKTRFKNEQN
ncbi:SdpI family protein [candidate division KSB1 bacterium]